MDVDYFLQRAKKTRGIGQKTIERLREQLINSGDIKKKNIEEVGFPDKKYDVIYADPPWKFETWSEKGKGRSAEQHYDCQGLEWIKTLPVEKISKENCILFLWITFPMVNKVEEVMNSWGFEFKGLGFNWVKRNKKSDSWFWGMGYWTRQNPEVCLIGTKGTPDRKNAGVHSVVDTKIEEHSKKPEEVRSKIDRLMGENTDKIELFARQQAEGWDCWGNETE